MLPMYSPSARGCPIILVFAAVPSSLAVQPPSDSPQPMLFDPHPLLPSSSHEQSIPLPRRASLCDPAASNRSCCVQTSSPATLCRNLLLFSSFGLRHPCR